MRSLISCILASAMFFIFFFSFSFCAALADSLLISPDGTMFALDLMYYLDVTLRDRLRPWVGTAGLRTLGRVWDSPFQVHEQVGRW